MTGGIRTPWLLDLGLACKIPTGYGKYLNPPAYGSEREDTCLVVALWFMEF